jgi:hypothetical protein
MAGTEDSDRAGEAMGTIRILLLPMTTSRVGRSSTACSATISSGSTQAAPEACGGGRTLKARRVRVPRFGRVEDEVY